MNKTFLALAALSAGMRFAGVAWADQATASSDRARIELAQYYERGGGYGGGGYGGYGYCETWAQGMVAMGAEAARKGCLQYGPQGLHTNYEAHIDWCLGVSRGRTQARAARANALLYSCNR